MKKILAFALVAATMTGCGLQGQTNAAGLPLAGDFTALGAGALPAGMAARADVEAIEPLAFALTPQGQPVVAALDAVVGPMRVATARAILGDAALMDGFGHWDTLGAKGQLAVLKQAVAHEGQVMGFQVPPITEKSGSSSTPGEMAFYAPSTHGIGKVTLFPDEISKGGKWMALATVMHEMRHAAQYQLLLAAQAKKLQPNSQPYTLAVSYNADYQALTKIGGEDKMNYGDYAHLTSEYDAFQTGNYIGAVVSHGQVDTSNLGFIDTQYDANGRVRLDLQALAHKVGASNLLAAVNQAEAGGLPTKGGNAKAGRAKTKRRTHRSHQASDVIVAADVPTSL